MKSLSPRRWRIRNSRVAVTLAVSVVVGIFAARASADASQLAVRLAKLRGEVEQLAQQLSNQSSDSKEALRSLARQRSDLELEQQREETRVQKLSAAIAKRRAEMQAEKAKGDRLVPVYQEWIVKVRDHVARTMPFRKEERLAALDKIDEQYKSGLISAGRALSRLWSFLEDEFRMTRESGLYKQTIDVDGDERLAEVVRVGMVTMFYKTDDGMVGHVTKHGDKWGYAPITAPDSQRQVLDLFSSFKKQIRVGYFELPNALPELSQ